MKIIRFTWDWIVTDFKKSVLSILIMSVSLILGMLSVMSYMEEKIAYISVDETLYHGVDSTLIVKFTDEAWLNRGDFIEKLGNRPEISACGAVELRGMENSELLAVQKGHAWNPKYSLENLVEVAYINYQGLGICDLKIKEGKNPSELSFKDEKVGYIYLGSEYNDIPIGRVYNYRNGYKCIVVGRLDESQKWINSDLIYGFNPDNLNYSWDCSYAVLCVESTMLSADCFVTVENGYTVDEAVQAMKEISGETSCAINYSTVKDVCVDGSEESKALTTYLFRLLIIIVVASTIMLVSIQVAIILRNARNYGIMYAIGFNKKEILSAQVLKQIILTFLAFVIAGVVIYFFAYNRYYLYSDLSNIIKTILAKYVFLIGILQAIMVVAIIQLITIIKLRRMTPNELIRNML